MEKRLYRVKEDRILFGVLAGIARYLELDPAIVRIAFILLCLVQPVFVLGYFLMAIAIPEKKAENIPGGLGDAETPASDYTPDDQKNRNFIGIVLVAIGAYVLLEEYVFFPFGIRELAGLLMVALGVYVLIKK
ncbi:PspC domain-containing protein [Geoglobus acetivorans]|uniref:Transcription regulator, PspC family n=1 Tax=Geoglobus acetivorans TaxID=565033 RepID=A0A0A7GG72_GEOAI|nr:Transcription regulator, PspC family [Geoglobus acetivorans]